VILSIALIGSAVAMFVAIAKNRNPFGWATAGFLLPVMGVLAVCCLNERPYGKEEEA
jgi:hypothetical protein